MNQPIYEDLQSLLTAAIECEGIGGSSMETLHALYEGRMKKSTWVGKEEIELRFALDSYLQYRGYKHPISTEITFAD
jgi:hypothetical protein